MSSDLPPQYANSARAFAATVEAGGGGESELGWSEEQGSIASFLRKVAQAPPVDHPDVRLGTHLGADDRYLLKRVLGRGGMGTVYEATDTLLGRNVALKLLEGSKSGRSERALSEARIAASLEHQRIARVYDVGSHGDDRFVAMELVRGTTLRTWMTQQAASTSELLTLASQIAEGLAGLHSGDIVHGDLKPENVMLDERGGIKLLDFGLARYQVTRGVADVDSLTEVESRRTQRDSIGGTPGYMAPEQYLGVPIDARADIFAFGVMMFELITGRRPFSGQNFAQLRDATLNEQAAFDDERWKIAPPHMREVVARSITLDPASRFGDGNALLKELERASTQPAPNRGGRFFRVGGRTRLRGWALAAFVGGGLLVSGSMWTRAKSGAPKRITARAPEGMIWVNEGTVSLGRTAEELERDCTALGADCSRKLLARETPARSEWIAPFALDRTEVTNLQLAGTLSDLRASLRVDNDEVEPEPRYVRWKGDSGHGDEVLVDLETQFGGIEYMPDGSFRAREGHQRLPAIQVSWGGALLHCTHVGKRLPSEDEWEAAARGHENRRFPWGDSPLRCGSSIIPQRGLLAAIDRECPEPAHPAEIATAPDDVSPTGLRDLGGNVAEWTSTVYVDGNGSQASESGQTLRVIRGGSWAHAWLTRTSARMGRPPESVGVNVGFRCARSL